MLFIKGRLNTLGNNRAVQSKVSKAGERVKRAEIYALHAGDLGSSIFLSTGP